jgi:hypothetical protein
MSDPKPDLPPWTFEGPAQQVRDDPERYKPGSSPIAKPIWSNWSSEPEEGK